MVARDQQARILVCGTANIECKLNVRVLRSEPRRSYGLYGVDHDAAPDTHWHRNGLSHGASRRQYRRATTEQQLPPSNRLSTTPLRPDHGLTYSNLHQYVPLAAYDARGRHCGVS
jgi:hypothetical protein